MFVRRYKMLTSDTWPTANGKDKANTEWILGKSNIGKDEYQLGKNKIFIRDPKKVFALEKLREEKVNEIVKAIQR